MAQNQQTSDLHSSVRHYLSEWGIRVRQDGTVKQLSNINASSDSNDCNYDDLFVERLFACMASIKRVNPSTFDIQHKTYVSRIPTKVLSEKLNVSDRHIRKMLFEGENFMIYFLFGCSGVSVDNDAQEYRDSQVVTPPKRKPIYNPDFKKVISSKTLRMKNT